MSATSLTYGADPDQIYERLGQPSSSRPTLVLIHGGYWRAVHDREHMRPMAEALAKLGWPVVLAEYRRSPHPPESTVEDINTLLSKLSAEPLVLIGFSVGGQLALLTASKHPSISQVIALAPVTDLVATEREGLGENAVREWLHESADQCPDFDPSQADLPVIPVSVFHGTADVRVPFEHSTRFVKSVTPKLPAIHLFEIDGAGHFDLLDPTHAYFAQMVHQLEQ